MYGSIFIEQLKAAKGVTEQLKEESQMEWIQRINNIQTKARELVCNELQTGYKTVNHFEVIQNEVRVNALDFYE